MNSATIPTSNEVINNIHPRWKTFPASLIVTGICSGYAPIMPGTVGTAAAALLAWLFYFLVPELASPLSTSLLAVFVALVGIASANYVVDIKYFGDNKDPQQVVIDEFAGFFVALAALEPTSSTILLAFLFFRIFDILKPWPVCALERLPRGWGIVLDDVFAGIYAGICIRLVYWW